MVGRVEDGVGLPLRRCEVFAKKLAEGDAAAQAHAGYWRLIVVDAEKAASGVSHGIKAGDGRAVLSEYLAVRVDIEASH